MLQIRTLTKLTRRLYSSVPPRNIIEELSQRTLIRVSGLEVDNYLQGLITNDIRHLDHGMGSMYTLFLNTKGRVLYDSIIYRTNEKNTYLIECDVQAVDSLQKHLKLFRVKRKIDVSSLADQFKIFCLFNKDALKKDHSSGHQANVKQLDGLVVPCTSLKDTLPDKSGSCKICKDLLVYQDPRIVDLGSRILAPAGFSFDQEIADQLLVQTNSDSSITYRKLRYNLGVGEGVDDLPPGNSLPLESNGDYLHGISFHKGCYLGQELTARTHHTGVIRKRLMPLFFTKVATEFNTGNPILNESVNLGKLRGVENDVGLALLRISQAIDVQQIPIGDGFAYTKKPSWWPLEMAKERVVHEQKS